MMSHAKSILGVSPTDFQRFCFRHQKTFFGALEKLIFRAVREPPCASFSRCRSSALARAARQTRAKMREFRELLGLLFALELGLLGPCLQIAGPSNLAVILAGYVRQHGRGACSVGAWELRSPPGHRHEPELGAQTRDFQAIAATTTNLAAITAASHSRKKFLRGPRSCGPFFFQRL